MTNIQAGLERGSGVSSLAMVMAALTSLASAADAEDANGVVTEYSYVSHQVQGTGQQIDFEADVSDAELLSSLQLLAENLAQNQAPLEAAESKVLYSNLWAMYD